MTGLAILISIISGYLLSVAIIVIVLCILNKKDKIKVTKSRYGIYLYQYYLDVNLEYIDYKEACRINNANHTWFFTEKEAKEGLQYALKEISTPLKIELKVKSISNEELDEMMNTEKVKWEYVNMNTKAKGVKIK